MLKAHIAWNIYGAPDVTDLYSGSAKECIYYESEIIKHMDLVDNGLNGMHGWNKEGKAVEYTQPFYMEDGAYNMDDLYVDINNKISDLAEEFKRLSPVEQENVMKTFDRISKSSY